MSLDATSALLGASALHLGFGLVVSGVVYPALADTPVDRWAAVHAAHSRRIARVVGPVYVAVAAACLWALLAGPSVWAWVAIGGNALAGVTTAVAAAPLHGRLGHGLDPALVRRLRRVDLIRTAGTAVATVGALLALA